MWLKSISWHSPGTFLMSVYTTTWFIRAKILPSIKTNVHLIELIENARSYIKQNRNNQIMFIPHFISLRKICLSSSVQTTEIYVVMLKNKNYLHISMIWFPQRMANNRVEPLSSPKWGSSPFQTVREPDIQTYHIPKQTNKIRQTKQHKLLHSDPIIIIVPDIGVRSS